MSLRNLFAPMNQRGGRIARALPVGGRVPFGDRIASRPPTNFLTRGLPKQTLPVSDSSPIPDLNFKPPTAIGAPVPPPSSIGIPTPPMSIGGPGGGVAIGRPVAPPTNIGRPSPPVSIGGPGGMPTIPPVMQGPMPVQGGPVPVPSGIPTTRPPANVLPVAPPQNISPPQPITVGPVTPPGSITPIGGRERETGILPVPEGLPTPEYTTGLPADDIVSALPVGPSIPFTPPTDTNELPTASPLPIAPPPPPKPIEERLPLIQQLIPERPGVERPQPPISIGGPSGGMPNPNLPLPAQLPDPTVARPTPSDEVAFVDTTGSPKFIDEPTPPQPPQNVVGLPTSPFDSLRISGLGTYREFVDPETGNVRSVGVRDPIIGLNPPPSVPIQGPPLRGSEIIPSGRPTPPMSIGGPRRGEPEPPPVPIEGPPLRGSTVGQQADLVTTGRDPVAPPTNIVSPLPPISIGGPSEGQVVAGGTPGFDVTGGNPLASAPGFSNTGVGTSQPADDTTGMATATGATDSTGMATTTAAPPAPTQPPASTEAGAGTAQATTTTTTAPPQVAGGTPFASGVTQVATGLDPLTEQLLFGLGGQGGFIPGAMRAVEKTFYDEQGNPIVIDEQVAGFTPDQLQAMQMQRDALGMQDPYLQGAGQAFGAGTQALEEGLQRGRTAAIGALEATKGGVGSLQEGLGESADILRGTLGGYDPSMTSQFYDPFEDRVVQQTITDIMEQGAKSDIGARASDIARGGESAFGSRARLGASERQEALGRGLAEALGGIRSRGFREAQQTGLSEFARQKAAERAASTGLASLAGQGFGGSQALASALSGLGQTEQDIGQQRYSGQFGLGTSLQGLGAQAAGASAADIAALYGMGSQQQGQLQAMLDAQRRNLQQRQMTPLLQYQALAPFISMAPAGQFTTTTQFAPRPSPMQSGLSTGLAAFGALGKLYGGS